MATLKLTNYDVTDISVTEMKDGDLAVITMWNSGMGNYVGRIVHRYKDVLVTIGKSSDNSWVTLFDKRYSLPDCRVRLLQPGDTLVVE